MTKLRNLLAASEYWLVRLLAVVFGISLIVRYLRNPNPAITVRLLRAYGASIGERTTVKRTLYLDNVSEDENSSGDFTHLCIGSNCSVGDGVYFDLANTVEIHDNVNVAGRTAFITHADCNRSAYLAGHYPRKCLRVTVGEGVWLGFDVKVMPGITVGMRSVVGSGSVVGENVEPMSVYAGVPATKIKSLEARELAHARRERYA